MHEFSICILHLKKFQNLLCLPPPKKSLTPTSRTKWPPPPEDICRMAGDELRMSWGCFRHSEPCTILCSYCYLFGSWCSTSWVMSPALFCFSNFSGRVLCFCLGLASHCNPPTCAAGMTNRPNHTWLVDCHGVLLTFCPGCPPTTTLPWKVLPGMEAGCQGWLPVTSLWVVTPSCHFSSELCISMETSVTWQCDPCCHHSWQSVLISVTFSVLFPKPSVTSLAH
jgi:hypothetical protein